MGESQSQQGRRSCVGKGQGSPRSSLPYMYHHFVTATIISILYVVCSGKTTSALSKETTSNSNNNDFVFVVFDPQRIVANEDEALSFYERNVSARLETGLTLQSHPNTKRNSIHYFCAVRVQYGSIQLLLLPGNAYEKNSKDFVLYLNGTQEDLEKSLSSNLIYVPSQNYFGADQVLAYCTSNKEKLFTDYDEEPNQKHRHQFITNSFDVYSFLSIIVTPINDPPTIHVNRTSFITQDDDSSKYLHQLLDGMIRIMDEDDDNDTAIGLPFNLPSTYMVNISAVSTSQHAVNCGLIRLPPKNYLGGLTTSEEKQEGCKITCKSIALVGPLPRIHAALAHVLFSPQDHHQLNKGNASTSTIGTITIQCWDIPREFRRTTAQLFIPNTFYTTNWATHIQTISFEIQHINRAPKVTFTCRAHSSSHGVLQTREDVPFMFCHNRIAPCLLEVNDADAHPQQEILSLHMTLTGPDTASCVGEFRLMNINKLHSTTNVMCRFSIQGTLEFLREAIRQMQIVFIPHWYGHSRLYVSLSDAYGAIGKDDILLMVSPWNDPPNLVASITNITVKHNAPTLLSTSTIITVHDPDTLEFTPGSASKKNIPTFTVTINATGCCGTVKFNKKVPGCYIVTNHNHEHIEDFLGPYSSVIFRGTLDVVNEAVASLIYLSSCHSNEVSSLYSPTYCELLLAVNDEGFYGGGVGGSGKTGSKGDDHDALEAHLFLSIFVVNDDSPILVSSSRSSYNYMKPSVSLNEYLGIPDTIHDDHGEEIDFVDDELSQTGNGAIAFSRTTDVVVNDIIPMKELHETQIEVNPALIYWNDSPLTHQEIVVYMIENTQLHIHLYNRQLRKGNGISIRREHNETNESDGKVYVSITAEFGQICEANSFQQIYDALPQDQVIILDKNEDKSCTNIVRDGNNSVFLLHGSLVELNKKLSYLIYVPPRDRWGVDKVTFSTNQSTNFASDKGLFDVVIKPTDDVPIIHINGTKEGPQSVPSSWETPVLFVQEDIPTLLPVIILSDRDSAPHQFLNRQGDTDNAVKMLTESMLLVDLTFTALHGQIKVNSHDKEVTVQLNGSETRLSGYLERINEVLALGISYLGNLNFHGADVISIVSANQIVIPHEEEILQIKFFRKIYVNVTPVNDVPVIIMPPTAGGVLVAVEDTPGFIGTTCKNGTDGNYSSPSIVSCHGIQVHDPEGGQLSVSLSIDHGTLSFSKPLHALESSMQIITVGSIELPNRVFTLQGTENVINNLLHGLIFIANRNFNSQFGGDLAFLKVDAKDAQDAAASSWLAIRVDSVNDPPVLLSSFDIIDPRFRTFDELSFKRIGCNTLQTKEDELTFVPGVKVRDVDAQKLMDFVEVEIFTSNGGLVVIAEDSPIENFLIGSRGVLSRALSFHSLVDEANEALQALHYQSASNFNGLDEIHIRVSDLVDSVSAVCCKRCGLQPHPLVEFLEKHEDYLIIPVEVVGVVDEPVMVIPDLLEVTEDTPFSLCDKFKVYHSDGTNTLVYLKLLCEHCTLIFRSTENRKVLRGLYTAFDDEKQHYRVEGIGSVTEWNLCLDDLTYISSPNWNTKDWSLDELSLTIRNYNLGEPMNVGKSREFVTLIDVKPLNDAPVWVVPGQNLKLQNTGGYIISSVDTLHVNEDEELAIESVSIFDADMTLNRWMTCDMLHVTLKVTSGTIEIANIAGLWIQQSHEKSILEWKGKLKFTNDALSTILYRGNTNFYGDDTLELYVSDQGCEGDGDILTSSVAISIAVHPVNDSPTWTVPWYPILCSKDKLHCSLHGVGVQDFDGDDSLMHVEISVDPGRISFSDIEVPSSIQFTESDWLFRDKEYRLHGSLRDVNTLLSRMRYHKDLEPANTMVGSVLIRLVVADVIGNEVNASSKLAYVLLQIID